MKKYLLILACTLSVFVLLISGCAKKPEAEIKRAENAIANAKQAGAEKWAAASLQAAEDKFKEAMDLVEGKKYKEALPALAETVRLADAAGREAAAAKRAEEERLAAAEAARKAAAAKRAEEERLAAEAARKAAEEERLAAEAARKAAEAKAAESHKVVEGECLWNIAGYGNTYNDPYQWQKIYEANQGIIQNPDLIYPGQVLDIPK